MFGGLLFGALVWSVGVGALWRDATRLGWGAALIVAVEGAGYLLRAAGWQRCFHGDHRPGVLRLWWPNLAGAATNFATPTATLGGEVVRAALAPAAIPRTDVVASLVVSKLTVTLADVTLALGGVAVVVLRARVSEEWRTGLLLGALLIVAGTAGFFWAQRSGRLAGLVGRRTTVARLLGPDRAARVRDVSEELDRRVAALHGEGAAAVLQSVLLYLASRLVTAFLLWLFLGWMGAPSDVGTVLSVFLVARAVEVAAFFVPAGLGTQEGGYMAATSLFGLAPSLGLLFSLAFRIQQIVWAAIGFGAYGVLVWKQPVGESSPRGGAL